MTIFNLLAKQDYLEKIARTAEPIKALSEFVWNSLDADATIVLVQFRTNALGGIDEIVIQDNGSGISHARAEHDFGNLGDSWKKTSRRTPSLQRAVHGKEGRGRLRFFSLAQRARWHSVYRVGQKLESLTIEIASQSLEKCEISDPILSIRKEAGTFVELSPLKAAFDWLLSHSAFLEFNAMFASYILQYPNIRISYHGKLVNPNETILRVFKFPDRVITCPNRTISDLSVKVVEWKSMIENRRIYLGGESGIVLGSQAAYVSAPDFQFSAYANCGFFQEIADANLLELDDLSDPDFVHVMDQIREQLKDYFRSRLAERSRGLIEELKSVGAYPYLGDPKDEVERKEREFFDIATYAVSSYSRDFKKAETSVKKMTLTLLREALRHNPDSLSTILRAVVNLPKARQDEFSILLQKTGLGNIIAASSMIAGRITAIEVLKGMIFNPQYRNTIRERGELDALIRDNTWIFGERFHITLPEAGLSRVMERVSLELKGKQEGRRVRKSDGKIGRVDCFLGRSVPHPEQERREFLVVELKRPSLMIGRTELDQLEDYVNAIKGQPDFSHTATDWNFYLVTGDYADSIRDRITQKNRPVGLFIEKNNSQVWVKTWSELIRDCESRLRFIQEKLRIEVSAEEIESRIEALRSSFQGIAVSDFESFSANETQEAAS